MTVQGVELTEDRIELPEEPVTVPKQITVYVTVCSTCFASVNNCCCQQGSVCEILPVRVTKLEVSKARRPAEQRLPLSLRGEAETLL